MNNYFYYVCAPIWFISKRVSKDTGLLIAIIWAFIIVPALCLWLIWSLL